MTKVSKSDGKPYFMVSTDDSPASCEPSTLEEAIENARNDIDGYSKHAFVYECIPRAFITKKLIVEIIPEKKPRAHAKPAKKSGKAGAR